MRETRNLGTGFFVRTLLILHVIPALSFLPLNQRISTQSRQSSSAPSSSSSTSTSTSVLYLLEDEDGSSKKKRVISTDDINSLFSSSSKEKKLKPGDENQEEECEYEYLKMDDYVYDDEEDSEIIEYASELGKRDLTEGQQKDQGENVMKKAAAELPVDIPTNTQPLLGTVSMEQDDEDKKEGLGEGGMLRTVDGNGLKVEADESVWRSLPLLLYPLSCCVVF